MVPRARSQAHSRRSGSRLHPRVTQSGPAKLPALRSRRRRDSLAILRCASNSLTSNELPVRPLFSCLFFAADVILTERNGRLRPFRGGRISLGGSSRGPALSCIGPSSQGHPFGTLATGLAMSRALRDSSFANRRCAPIELTQNDRSGLGLQLSPSSFLTSCREAESWAQDDSSARRSHNNPRSLLTSYREAESSAQDDLKRFY